MHKEIKVTINNTNINKKGLYLRKKGYAVIKLNDMLELLGEEYFKISDLAKVFCLEAEELDDSILLTTQEWNNVITKGLLKNKIIILDPGHHKSENLSPVDTRYTEGNYVLITALYLKKLLISEGATVYLTRKDEKEISLIQRGSMYQNLKPDLFISIHTNALGKKIQTNVSGIEIVYSVKHPEDIDVCKKMLNIISKEMNMKPIKIYKRYSSKSTDKKLIDWNIELNNAVNDKTHGFIIVGGFHDNPHDFKALTENKGTKRFAQAIYLAILSYFNK